MQLIAEQFEGTNKSVTYLTYFQLNPNDLRIDRYVNCTFCFNPKKVYVSRWKQWTLGCCARIIFEKEETQKIRSFLMISLNLTGLLIVA